MTAATGSLSWAVAANARDAVPDREEARWVARARTGDDVAVRWLLDRYRGRAVRLAAHVLRRRPEDAQDVAQEAFLRAFGSLTQLRGDGFGPWLFRIVVRLCLDRRRQARWDREVGPEAAPEWPAQAPSPAQAIDTRLLVESLLDRLSPPMRAALILRELEGMEYEEIAQALGIPVGTVRSRLNAARAQFRQLWTQALGEANDA